MSSPPIFGTSLTPQDIEARFQSIEFALAQLMPANFTANTSTVTPSIRATAPDVSGLKSAKVVNGIIFSWDPVSASNLSTYEIQISTSSAFLGANTIQVGQNTSYTFTTGSPNVTYYARVRAVIGFSKGNWTKSINSQTGLVDTGNLETGATNALVQDITLSFSPASLAVAGIGSLSAIYGQAQITTTGGIVVPFSQSTNDIASTYGVAGSPNRIQVDFLRDGLTVDSVVTDSNSTFSGRLTFSAFGLPDIPPAGAHLYQAKITVTVGNGANSLSVTPVRLILSLIEYK